MNLSLEGAFQSFILCPWKRHATCLLQLLNRESAWSSKKQTGQSRAQFLLRTNSRYCKLKGKNHTDFTPLASVLDIKHHRYVSSRKLALCQVLTVDPSIRRICCLTTGSMLSCHIIMQPAQINSDKIIILYCILTLYWLKHQTKISTFWRILENIIKEKIQWFFRWWKFDTCS